MKKYILGFALLFVMAQIGFAQTASIKNKMEALIQDNFAFAAKQYQYFRLRVLQQFTVVTATRLTHQLSQETHALPQLF